MINWKTTQSRIARLKELKKMSEGGASDVFPRKEVTVLIKQREKLERFLGGIEDMPRVPDVMLIVDPHKEQIAVKEAQKLHIPIVAMVDTSTDPGGIDYVTPPNDDAIRAARLITSKMADALVEGKQDQDGAQQETANDNAASETVSEDSLKNLKNNVEGKED